MGDRPAKDVDPAHEAGLLTCLRVGDRTHKDNHGVHTPDITINNLDELVTILGEMYGVAFGS